MWFKVCDKFHANKKARRLRRSHGTKRRDASAHGVWVQAGSWSGDNLSDGFVPEEVVESFDDDWREIAERLVEAGLWVSDEVDGEPGWRFVHWSEFNDEHETVMRDRQYKKMRTALQRDTALITAIKRRDKDRCRYCGTQVNWRAHRGPAAATYDHVKPLADGGTNVLDNVVVACKGCNDRKNRRTLREAGMRLLAPGSMGAPVLDSYSVQDGNVPVPSASPPRSTTGSGRVGSGAQNVFNTEAEPQRAPERV